MRNELYHHGVLGMHWGVRRYQNKDGSLTPAGQKHRQKVEAREVKKEARWQAKKSKIIGKGDVDSALKNVERLTPKEIEDIITKHASVMKLKDASIQQIQRGEARTRSIGNTFRSISTGIADAVSIYNNAAKLSNAILGTKYYTTSDHNRKYDSGDSKKTPDNINKWVVEDPTNRESVVSTTSKKNEDGSTTTVTTTKGRYIKEQKK